MKVLHITNSDVGGAGLAAVKYHAELIKSGIDSVVVVKSKSSNIDKVYEIDKSFKSHLRNFIYKLSTKFYRKKMVDYIYLFFGLGYKTLKNESEKLSEYTRDVDCIIIHWASEFFSLTELSSLNIPKKTKVIINLVDMRMLTGGCHFSYSCEKYKEQCIICPATNNTYIQEEIRNNFIEESIIISDYNISVISPVRHVLEQAKASAKPFSNYTQISAYISQSDFTFVKSNHDNKVILLGAYSSADVRKGVGTSYLVLEKLNTILKNYDFHVDVMVPFGHDFVNLKTLANINFSEYSLVSSEKSLSDLYNNCDVFLSTSIDDTGPAMIIESLFCGTPVVATNTGVTKELFEFYSGFGRASDIFDIDGLANDVYEVLFGHDPIERSTSIELKAKEYYTRLPKLSEFLRK